MCEVITVQMIPLSTPPLFCHFTIPLITFSPTIKRPGSEIVYLKFVLLGKLRMRALESGTWTNFSIRTFKSRRFSKFFVDLTPYRLCAESLVCILFKRGVQISPDNYGNGFGTESTRYSAEWLLRRVTGLPSAWDARSLVWYNTADFAVVDQVHALRGYEKKIRTIKKIQLWSK